MTDHKTTILLVDDKPEFLETLAERVSLEGYRVLTAATGQEAIETAEQNEIHLAVVDLKMPDMDGLACITKLKTIHPDVQAVLLTAYGSDKMRHATQALNTTYFEKQDMGRFWEFIKGFSHRPTFLLVDDDEAFLDTLSQRVLLKGFEVLTATTPDEAVELARTKRIDYAVVDLRLKDADGLELITRLKEEQPGMETMLLTGFGSERLKEATEALNSIYFEKQDMGGFWEYIRRLSKRMENMMAAAGMADQGGHDHAKRIESGENGS
jgi:ActR/RegA family two-component response regulator